jgi:crotonobetainyl-CoA:carnitine CoA-transferase CaiB-like acyl-CoA transferase
MPKALDGVKVLEVAAWMFVPAAGAILADWGADVIKVEHPETGDPMRGLVSMGLIPGGSSAVNYIIEQPNRGKRSIGLDISTPHGLEMLYKIAESCDVFLTSFLPETRQKLKIDVEHLRAVNPNIIYCRGTGQGPHGPDSAKGGLDGAVYWARAGISHALTPPCAEYPIGGRAGFGDLAGGMTVAGGIASALFQRERSGVASVVDVSLLAVAMWMLSPDIVASGLYGGDPIPHFDRMKSPNPLVGFYRTQDQRFLSFMLLQSDRFWPDFCRHIDRPELIEDERFKDGGARMANGPELITLLDEVFAGRPLTEWIERLQTLEGVWAAVQTAAELANDPQVIANGYLREIVRDDGVTYDVVASPVMHDEVQPDLVPAPEHGQHTEEILLEVGYDWDEIIKGKELGSIL